jgi:hypothetical protein
VFGKVRELFKDRKRSLRKKELLASLRMKMDCQYKTKAKAFDYASEESAYY